MTKNVTLLNSIGYINLYKKFGNYLKILIYTIYA